MSQALSTLDEEFTPLPYFPWDERPPSLPLDPEECATAIHLAHGEFSDAAQLLKVPLHRLTRLVDRSPRLQRVAKESLQLLLIRAAAVPIRTLYDKDADARRLEWASTKVLQSRLAQGHPLSPAPANGSSSVTLTDAASRRTVTFRWGDGTVLSNDRPDGPVIDGDLQPEP